MRGLLAVVPWLVVWIVCCYQLGKHLAWPLEDLKREFPNHFGED